MEAKGSQPAFAAYLASHDKSARLRVLAGFAEKTFPVSLAEDLLALDLGLDEKASILEAVGSKDTRALEHFLTQHLFTWPQELAALAVRLWDERTEHLLWYRVLEACRSAHLSQRVLYTILDHGFVAGGARLVETIAGLDGLKDLSPAFQGLLLHRATQFGVRHANLEALAEAGFAELRGHLHPENKALASAIAYRARFEPASLAATIEARLVSEPWREYLRAVAGLLDVADKHGEKLAKLVQKPPKTKAWSKVYAAWPPLWQRHALDAQTVATAMRLALAEWPESAQAAGGGVIVSHAWEAFAGIGTDALMGALSSLDDEVVFASALQRLGGLLPCPAEDRLLELTKSRVAGAKDPAAVLSLLPLRLRLELTEGAGNAGKPSAFAELKAEEAAVLKKTEPASRPVFQDYKSGAEDQAELAARKRFFDLAYRGATPPKGQGGTSFWDQLTDAWQTPGDQKLAALAQISRQVDGVFRLCYLNTLGRFKGHDQAALKLLDFIRSKEEDDLRAVISALGGIATPRAAQELVSALTRPNVTPALQLEICQVLQKQELSNLQNELRSALKDLKSAPGDEGAAEVREAIASLLTTEAAAPQAPKAGTGPSAAASDAQLDAALSAKIQNYRDLSSEVKRALRTSQFFHLQVTGTNAPESIDLSPVIDMQYKALELLFREAFEETCSRLIHRGVLQRRLDVIGYARPIPRAMDEFEAYVASLPTIKDIPFFSKFKLRKMLRAICQFRPGKRFTLDGLKAFALFFLCFSRSECRYGLAGLFPVGLRDDAELYDFCKALHVLQDFRNRAAHEGFHPDASNDIDGIWRATAEIVQTMFKVKRYLDSSAENEYAPKSRSAPVIEKKVS